MHGSIEMDVGAANVEFASGARRVAALVADLKQGWIAMVQDGKLPEPVQKLETGDFAKAAETSMTLAGDAYAKAATVYNDATRLLPADKISQNIRWVYEASEAKAWRAQAAIGKDPGVAQQKASTLEASAKLGREGSPYLRDVDSPALK